MIVVLLRLLRRWPCIYLLFPGHEVLEGPPKLLAPAVETEDIGGRMNVPRDSCFIKRRLPNIMNRVCKAMRMLIA